MRFSFRLVISTLAGLTAFTAVPLLANHMDMVDVSGHARTRLMFSDNTGLTDTDNSETLVNRVRLNVDVSPTKTLQVRITPEFTNTWGTLNAPSDATFTAHEAWMAWMPNSAWAIYVGRQVLAYGNGLIIGNDDWANVAANFDAARARYNHSMGTTDFIYAKIVERSGTALGGDHGLWGVYNAFTPGRNMATVKGIDAYVFFDDDRGTTTRNRNGTLGARIDGDVQAVDYNLELAGQYGYVHGSSDSQKGIMTDAEVGAKIMEKNRVALNVGYGNSEWTELFPETHKYLGKADVILSRNNLVALAVLTNWAFNHMWSAGVDGHYFIKAKDDVVGGGGLATAAKRPMGMELDLTLNYKPEDRLTFEAGYDVFKPLDALEDAGKNHTNNNVYLQGTLSF